MNKKIKCDCGIYQIYNVIDENYYIGQSVHFHKRKIRHFGDLRRGEHDNSRLQRVYNKYGENSFVFSVLIYCEEFELTRYEKYFDNYYKKIGKSYNLRDCVESNKGLFHTEETKEKMSLKMKDVLSKKYREFPSLETREKISIKNKNMSEETRNKMSIAKKGKPMPEETKKKISNTRIEKYKEVKKSREKNKIEKINSSFFDKEYFENGIESGKSWYVNYKWQPQRSFREGLALIDVLALNENSRVLDIGCGKGFLVRALNELEILAEGCDISEYALSFAPSCCWNCSSENSWKDHYGVYTNIIIKDMLEHLTIEQLDIMLLDMKKLATSAIIIVPMGDLNTYRIPEYHCDKSHLIIENEEWWEKKFENNGWTVVKNFNYIKGIKDSWYHKNPRGNRVFVLEKK